MKEASSTCNGNSLILALSAMLQISQKPNQGVVFFKIITSSDF